MKKQTGGYMDSVAVITTDHTPDHEARRAHYLRYGVAPPFQVGRYDGPLLRFWRAVRAYVDEQMGVHE